jgi:hypothetical protein
LLVRPGADSSELESVLDVDELSLSDELEEELSVSDGVSSSSANARSGSARQRRPAAIPVSFQGDVRAAIAQV